jgi:hypothetical protein
VDNVTQFKDLEIGEVFKYKNQTFVKTYPRKRTEGGVLNAFMVLPGGFEHVDDDAEVRVKDYWNERRQLQEEKER